MSLDGVIIKAVQRLCFAVLLFCFSLPIFAAEGEDQIYFSVEQFKHEAFSAPQSMPPETKMLWLTSVQRDEAKKISGEDPGFRRRYWHAGGSTAWVLDVIGRDHPITVGVALDENGIRAMRVLVYRESRGWEVRHDFFTRQFDSAELKGAGLDRRIDNITGATLSVNALQRAARLALWLHQRAMAD